MLLVMDALVASTISSLGHGRYRGSGTDAFGFGRTGLDGIIGFHGAVSDERWVLMCSS